MRRLLFIFLTLYGCQSLAEEVVLARGKSAKDPRQAYLLLLLEKALNYKTDQSKLTVSYSDGIHSRERIKALMKIGKSVDVQATATRPDWEEELLTIRIPIYKGLLGYRILLIHKDQQAAFSAIKEIDELKAKTALLGSQWSITPSWKTNGFKTLTNLDYDSLFKMLHFKRADYFPRGANEILQEFELFQTEYPNIAIENNLAIYLPLPTYFFVTPHKPKLAKRLENNLEQMVADGEFNRFFLKHFDDKIQALKINQRRTFFIENPNLPEKTPIHRKELWYSAK